MSKKASIIVSDGVKNVARVVDANSAVKIKAKSGVKYLLKGERDDEAPENVTVRRVGDDLHITLEGEATPAVVLEGYYALSDAPGLYGVAEDGHLYAYVRTDGAGGIFSLSDGIVEPVALGGDSLGSGDPYLALSESNDDVGIFWPLMLLGGLAGLGFAAINASRDSSSFVPPADKQPVAPPRKPGSEALSAVMDDVGSIQGPIANGGVTDDPQPEFIGNGEPGNVITIYDNGKPIGSALVDDEGHWRFTPPEDGGLVDGKHSITVTETSEGGESEHSDPFEFEVDTKAPDKPGLGDGLDGAIDDVGTITGPIANGDVTDDTRPEFNGSGEPGSTIVIEDNGKEIGTAKVGDDGKWTFTPEEDLEEGEHSIIVKEADKAGNTSEPSDPYEFTVDTTPPDKPGLGDGLDNAIDDVGTITGPIANGDVTDDTRPEFNGSGEPGSTIVIEDNGKEIGTAKVGDDGRWSFTPEDELDEGDHSIVIKETDKAGNTSEPSDPYEFTVDTTPPIKPELGDGFAGADDDVGEIQGPIANGDVTDDARPEFNGVGEPDSTIVIEDNGKEIGTATVGDDGKWSFIPEEDLEEGEHSIIVKEADKAGNTSEPSDPYEFTVDTTAPDASKLAITGVEDDVGGVTGNVPAGATTDDSRPVISGTGTAGDTVIVMVKDNLGSRELGRATIDEDGNWSLPAPTPLASGDNEFTAIEMDPAGNKTAPSDPYAVVVSITPPAAPVIQNVLDDVGVAHFMQKGEVTDDDKPTIIGTAQADSIVKVYDGVLLLGSAQADASGQWSFTPTEALKDGSHDITATATNLIGQTSDATGIWNFVVDSQAPDAVSDLVVTDDVGARTGPLVDGDTTDDATPTFTGKAEPDSTVSVYDNGTRIGEAVADENGDWSFTPSKPLPDGDHAFTTVVTDPAGNVGAPSTPVNVAIDTADVTVSIGTLVDDQGAIKGDIAPNGVTDDVRPEIQGTGKAGSTITVYDGAMELGTTQVRRDGTWSFTPEADLGEGEHSITATATDKAGTVSEPTAPFDFSVDTQSPQAPTIGAAQDDVGAITGPLADGDTTDDPTPTLSGKAEPGSTVSVYDNGELLGTVSADKDGGWSYTPTTPLPEGEHEFKVTATDRAGNVSDESDPITLITDYTAPDASKLAITGVEDDVGGVTGNVPAGATTDDNRPVISGTGTTGDTIIVMVKDSLGSRELGRTTIDEDGNWSLPVTTPLTSGDNEFTATEMDLAGNSTESAPYAVNVIGGKPPVPVIVNVQDDVGAVHFLEKGEVTDDAKPTIIGTAEKGSIVKIYDGGTSLGSVQADEHGQWSFTPSDALKDGAHDITATATDAIGRTSDATGIWNFVVDTRAPDAASDLVVTDDVGARTGPLADGDTTDDATPTFSGTAEPGGTVSVYDNGVKIGDAVADETTGDWSFTPSKALPDGDHAFKTVVTDPAGNASAPSAPVNVTIDTKDVTVSIDALADDQGAITGDIAPNGVTDDLRPEVKGQGKAGSTITVYDGTTELGTTEVKPDGTWSFTPSTDLGQGAHSITATATEKSGNISAPTAPFNFSVDSEKPTVRTIDAAQDDVGAIQQSLHDGDTTDDPTPTLSGTAEPNSKVTVYDNGTPLGTANADKDGKWSFTPTTTLPEGEHEFTITATDKAGNASDKSAPFTLITDYTPPDATIDIIGISDDTGVPDDFITKDDQIIIHGRISRLLQPDERVQISSDGGKTWADVNVAARIWSSSQPLSQGDNTFDARIIDKAGNVGGTDSQVVTLDTTPPTQTASIVGYVDDEGSVAGDFDFSSHPTTDDASPLLKGTLSAGLATGDTVEIYRDGLLIGTAEVNDTDWTFQDDGLTGGTHVYTAKVVDIAGNAGNPSGAASLTYDSLLSLQANDTVVHEAALQGGTGKDWLANDSSNTGDLTASGTFSLGSSVTNITITLGGQSTGLTLADLASGKTITIGGDTLTITNLGNGEYGYTYTLGVPKSHDTSGGKVGEIVNNDFKITATGAGGTAEATGEIRIVNDEVTASPDDFVIDMPKVAEGVVLTLVLDSSPSMELLDGGTQSRWALAKQSLLNLLDKYAEAYPAGTSFEINLVAFDGVDSKWPNSIQSYTFNSIADAKAAIEARTVGYSGTYYDNALIEAQKLIQASRNKHPDYDQKVYFITDGEPEAGHGVPVSWSNFVTANQDALDVYGVGLGPAVNTPSASNEIKKALATGDPKDLFIPVVNAEDLSEALMDTLPTVDGNLFNQTANGKPESVALGADGGFTLSKVAFDGQDYVFGADGTVTIQVVTGLTMTIDDKGNYKIITSLASPNLKVPMIFTLTDADGDTSVVTEQLQFGDPSRPTLAALHETSNTVDDSSLDMLHSEDGIGIFFDARAGDELVGTAGNDTFKISAADFGHLDGGAGIDTLVMDAKDMHIDLSALGLQSIEKFDLGTGGNTLTLGAKEVLANGQTDLMLADGKTQMVVNGAFGDVDLLGGNTGPDGWASEGVTQVDGVTYNIYTNLAGTSELLVENKVHVTIL